MSKPLTIHILSDSLGRTAKILVEAVISQFPQADIDVITHSFIKSLPILEQLLKEIKISGGIIVHTNVKKEQADFIQQYCQKEQIEHYDLMTELLQTISWHTQQEPTEKIGARLSVDEDYFERIDSIEFAVSHDDGANSKDFKQAEIILLGPSRSSKTPLSIYLANLNYKVSNLPLYPETQLPDEIYEVDSSRLFGLINDIDVLQSVRRDRMLAYGMSPNSYYASAKRIQEELDYCQKVYQKLNCQLVHVAHKSIEETAGQILAHFKYKHP